MPLVALMLVSGPVNASIDCPVGLVEYVQPQKSSILYRQNGTWRRLGAPDGPGVDEMYAALLAAMMADREVVVRYPDGFDCTATDYGTDALMVRVL